MHSIYGLQFYNDRIFDHKIASEPRFKALILAFDRYPQFGLVIDTPQLEFVREATMIYFLGQTRAKQFVNLNNCPIYSKLELIQVRFG
jgi:hypothetical protein